MLSLVSVTNKELMPGYNHADKDDDNDGDDIIDDKGLDSEEPGPK